MPGPTQNVANAISAYNRVLKGADSGAMATKEPQGDSGEFADLVKGAIREAIAIGKRSENMSLAGIQERADLNQVATAIAEAETTLQTVVAVRDKLIDAYKEIMRMPM